MFAIIGVGAGCGREFCAEINQKVREGRGRPSWLLPHQEDDAASAEDAAAPRAAVRVHSRLSVDLLPGSGGKILILIEGLFLLKILPFVSSWSTTFF